jgi:antitoxin PrlF
MSNTKRLSPTTTVTVKGQVTLSKAVRDASGIHPGDKVRARALPEGGVLIERDRPDARQDEFKRTLQEIAARKPFRGMTTDETMRLTRGDE